MPSPMADASRSMLSPSVATEATSAPCMLYRLAVKPSVPPMNTLNCLPPRFSTIMLFSGSSAPTLFTELWLRICFSPARALILPIPHRSGCWAVNSSLSAVSLMICFTRSMVSTSPRSAAASAQSASTPATNGELIDVPLISP